MIVIKDQNGNYLSRLNTAQPSDMKDDCKNFIFNSYFNCDLNKAMKFGSKAEAKEIIKVIDGCFELEVVKLKHVVYHKGDKQYLISIETRRVHDEDGDLVAKTTTRWSGNITDALRITDVEVLKNIVAICERSEVLNGNVGYVESRLL